MAEPDDEVIANIAGHIFAGLVVGKSHASVFAVLREGKTEEVAASVTFARRIWDETCRQAEAKRQALRKEERND